MLVVLVVVSGVAGGVVLVVVSVGGVGVGGD